MAPIVDCRTKLAHGCDKCAEYWVDSDYWTGLGKDLKGITLYCPWCNTAGDIDEQTEK